MADQTSSDFAPGLLDKATQQAIVVAPAAGVKDILKDGVLVDGTPRSKLNFITAVGMALTLDDNSASDRVDITIAGPGARLDYQQITGDVAGITGTTEGTASTVITGNSITYDGTRVMIVCFAPRSNGSAAGTHLVGVLLRDTTVLGQWEIAATGGGDSSAAPALFFDTPSAAAHTYTMKAYVTTGTGIVRAGAGGAGALVPAFIRVTKD